MSRALKWLEITADYRCNNRCLGCYSVDPDDGPGMDRREAFTALARGREQGATQLWLGGGEPTLRKDLIPIVLAAKKLGYRKVRLQTNGMLLAYPALTKRLAEAGVDEVHFSLKGADQESHDRLTGTPGCHDLLLQGIALAREQNLTVAGDILVYRSSQGEIPRIVRRYHELGLERFDIWLFSVIDPTPENSLVEEVPRLSEVVTHIQAAMDLGLSERPDFITSLHTPPCTLPDSHAAARFHAASLDLLVTNPGGHSFMLEDSPIEGGLFFERCAECRSRTRCNGARADYVAIHGSDEFQPH